MTDIVVIGSLNMDLVVRTERLPAAGETVHGEDLRLFPGGKGANQAVAAARLGGRVAMVGRVGQDEFGSLLLKNLAEAGVDTHHVQQDAAAATGTALITVDSRGENCIVLSGGANQKVARSDVDAAEGLIAQAKLLLLQLEIPLDTVYYALQVASRWPVQVILNPAPAAELPPDILTWVDCLVPNEVEAQRLTGLAVDDLDSASEAAGRLVKGGAAAAIITLGSQGALLATAEGSRHVPSFAIGAVDTTAAGDAFIGGLSVALVRGLPLEAAVRFANGVGALATTRLGAQASLPNQAEVASFLEVNALL